MKAAYINEPCPPDGIVYGDLPDPTQSGREVLVRVGAVSLNPIDTYVRSGAVAMALPRPFVVGCDLAGTVEAVGDDVSRFQVGDRVWGTNQGLFGRQGTFAQRAAVDECWLYPTPPDVRDEDAAAASLVGVTAHLGLVRDAALRRDETIAVIGGSGGVGSTVVQMAKAIGARVVATAGSDEKVEICRALGADVVIAYRRQDIGDGIRAAAPDGVDVFWETRRTPDFDLAVDTMAECGRMVLMAGRDARPPFPVGPFYLKQCTLHGTAMLKASAADQRVCAEDISQWLASGALRPRVDRILHLSDAAEAHALQERSTVGGENALSGKIVLVI
ncbi:MAG: quinone oxidoreductase [Phycisphaeraceae bacterium]|nr:quinone oxidoreductase [Phycisphaeraceae bacterium]